MHWRSGEVSAMKIHRVVLIVMVALAPVTTALAGDHATTPQPNADASPPTAAVRPAQAAAPAKSPVLREPNSRGAR
jgi:hypothetical protein